MKALGISHEIDNLSQIEMLDIGIKEPVGSEVLVEVHSVGVNPADYRTLMIRSMGQTEEELKKMGMLPRPLPVISGYDFSGIIQSVGPDVKDFKIGDEVYGRPHVPNCGAFCEFYTIDESLVAPKLKSISHSQAATIPIPFQTAYINLITKAHLKKSQSILILGGAGGVGNVAIQIAKEIGARVIATGLSKDVERLLKLDIDGIINIEDDNLDIVDEKFDVMFDTVGLNAQKQALHLIKDGGAVTSCVMTDPSIVDNKTLVVCPWEFANGDGNMLKLANSLIEKGVYKPVYEKEYPFTADGYKTALENLWTNKKTGRQVLKLKN